ncbi:MAG: cation:proton antiporter [Candidatus Omnitrophica bacterium]|nr:cation:proton antiporter [Candidatus Omnitrophota bacterium]
MSNILIVGIIIFVGFIIGQIFQRFRLPKILGYLLAGVLLNPSVCGFVPKDITTRTDIIENIAIAFIAFSIGGIMIFPELKKLGKGIIYITIFEAQVTFLVITLGFIIALPFIAHIPAAGWFATFIPLSLLLGCLGSPTDPSVALAVTHQYNAKGELASTMLNVAGFDDILGIINFSVAVVIAKAVITHEAFSVYNALIVPVFIIAGSVVLGAALGAIFNFLANKITKQTEGVLFVLILSFLTLCWGVAAFINVEEILSVMVMGIVVVNFNPMREKIFKMLERYSEELVFLLFFTLSGMHLDFSVISTASVLLAFFVIYRIIGKFAGTFIGAGIAHSSPAVKKYTATGLIPFGGIVIGLALIMHQDPAFSKISGFLVSTIVGATIINEFIGPILVKKVLKSAGEIR